MSKQYLEDFLSRFNPDSVPVCFLPWQQKAKALHDKKVKIANVLRSKLAQLRSAKDDDNLLDQMKMLLRKCLLYRQYPLTTNLLLVSSVVH